MMWMEFECGTSFLPETPEARQDFFPLVSLKGLSDTRTNDKLFFVFFCGTETRISRIHTE
jgi:hypothetical protein